MINPHRTAFPSQNNSNESLEFNLDKIVNLTSQKLKELINKKQEKQRESGQLRAQRGVLESDIAYYDKETKDKEEQLKRLIEDLINTEKDCMELDYELKNVTDQYNTQNSIQKDTVNFVIKDLDLITLNNGIEETNKKSDTRLEYESYLKVKEENKLLMEKLHDYRRELYYLEVIKKFIFRLIIKNLQIMKFKEFTKLEKESKQ